MGDEAARLEFLARAEELADALYGDLRLLRAAGAGRGRRAALDRAFRHAHTIKGSAAASPSAAPVVRLAHALEDLLDAARAGRVRLDAATLDACESAADSLARALDSLARGRPDAEAEADAAAERLRARLREAELPGVAAAENVAAAAVLKSLPAEIAAGLNDAERRRLAAAAGEGARVVSVRVAFDLERLDEDFRRFGDALEALGETIATLPGAPDATAADDATAGTVDATAGAVDAAARVSFNLVCATSESRESLARGLSEFGAEVDLLIEADAGAGTSGAAGGGAVGADAWAVSASAGESLEGESGVGGVAGAQAAAGVVEIVRVPLAELDELAFAASELFDDTSAALEAARGRAGGVGEADGAAGSADEFERRAARLRQQFLALEERVLALRMQPLAPALERAARAGRIAARAAGKEVEIEIDSGSARVDRAVAEKIVEPLVHLLRNAVDHGVEPAAARRASGKAARGRVCLRSTAEGASVRVSVEDDGGGIDLAGVERAARAAGLVAEGARMTEGQALRLIFRPGFSTAGRVTETSGRGVGLDAVERAVERAGGEVRVRTRAGRGTTFELRLPLALALVPVVLVESAGETYAVDAARVVEAGRLERAAITAEGVGRRAAWRGRDLAYVSLAALLGRAAGDTPPDVPRGDDEGGRVSVVVVSLGDASARRAAASDSQTRAAECGSGAAAERAGGTDDVAGGAALVAVAVDRIAGRRDALVRGLGRHATRWRGVGGAIDLRDGAVALLLDLASLVEMKEG